MANDAKELKIEYKVINSQFNQGIRDINSQITSLNKSFRAQQEQMKLSASSTEKMHASLDKLNKQYELAKQKTEAARKGLENAKATMGENSKEAQQWQNRLSDAEREEAKLKNEIILTSESLRKQTEELKKQANPLNKMGESLKKAGENMQKFGSKMKSFGDSMGKKISAPIVAGAGMAVKAFKDVDAGMDAVTEKTGATGTALHGMQENMKNLATSIPTDFETAGNAVGEVNTKFGLTGQALEDLSGKFIKFAKLNGTDVSNSVDQVSNVLQTFNMKGDEAGKVMDVLNGVGQNTGISMDELSQNISKNAGTLQDLGLNAYDSAIFLGDLHQAGIDSSTAMQGLKKAFAESAYEEKNTKEALKDFDQYMSSSASDADKKIEAIKLFGSRAGASLYELAKSGKLNMGDLSSSVSDSMGSVENTFENVKDPVDEFQETLNQAKAMGAEFGQSLGQFMLPVLKTLSDKMKDIASRWKGLSPATQEMIGKIVVFAAVAGPAIAILGKMVSGLGGIFKWIGALSGFVAANPVILIIAGIVAAGVGLFKHWDQVKAKASELKEHISGVWDSIKQKTENIFGPIGQFMSNTWNGISNFISGSLGKIKSRVSSAWDNIKTKTSSTWGAIKSNTSSTWDNVKSKISSAAEGAKGKISGAWDNIKSKTSSTWGNIKSSTSSTWENVKSTISKAMSSAFNSVKNGMHNMAAKLREHLPHPTIELPVLSISGKFSLHPPSVPHFGLRWVKFALGGLLKAPTLFGMSGNNLLYGGEAGPEAVIPLKDSVLAGIGKGIAQSMPLPETGTTVYVTMNNQISSDYDADRAVRRLDEDLGRLGVVKRRGAGRL